MIRTTRCVISIKNARRLVKDQTSIDRVTRFVDDIRKGAKFPPILVGWQGGKRRLFDGNHRIMAYDRAGITQVECWLLDKGDLEKTIKAAFGGEWPGQFYVLDKFVLCDGVPYSHRDLTELEGSSNARYDVFDELD